MPRNDAMLQTLKDWLDTCGLSWPTYNQPSGPCEIHGLQVRDKLRSSSNEQMHVARQKDSHQESRSQAHMSVILFDGREALRDVFTSSED